MSLKTIKGKIRSVEKTHQVTKAMEAVSAVKMRKSQEAALRSRPYARHALTVLQRVSESVDICQHPLARPREVQKLLLVVITSDKGLAGSFNTKVLKQALDALGRFPFQLLKDHVSVVAVGRKAADFFAKRGFRLERFYRTSSKLNNESALRELVDALSQYVTEGRFDGVNLVYTNFRSTFKQEAVARAFLPIDPTALSALVEGITPERGKYAEAGLAKEKTERRPYTFEPSAQEVLDEIVPFLLRVQMRYALLESQASEHSARMVAMKNASDKAEELTQELVLKFNQARQSAITKELSEIVGGAEALRS